MIDHKEEILKRFEAYLDFRNLEDSTITRYLQVANNFLDSVSDLSKASIIGYLNSLGEHPGYKKFVFAVISRVFKSLELKWPFDKGELRLPSYEKKQPYLKKEEITKLLEISKSNPRDHLLFKLSSLFGFRRTEFQAFNREDYNKPKLFVRTAKHGVPADLMLDDEACMLLDEYLSKRKDHSPALFVGEQGRLSLGQLSTIFRRYADQLDIPKGYGFHASRRAVVTLLKQGTKETRGMTNKEVQELMRWKTDMTPTYEQAEIDDVIEKARAINPFFKSSEQS